MRSLPPVRLGHVIALLVPFGFGVVFVFTGDYGVAAFQGGVFVLCAALYLYGRWTHDYRVGRAAFGQVEDQQLAAFIALAVLQARRPDADAGDHVMQRVVVRYARRFRPQAYRAAVFSSVQETDDGFLISVPQLTGEGQCLSTSKHHVRSPTNMPKPPPSSSREV